MREENENHLDIENAVIVNEVIDTLISEYGDDVKELLES